MGRTQERYELVDLLTTEELKAHVWSLGKHLFAVGGIVRYPRRDEQLPEHCTDPRDLEPWYVVRDVGFDRLGKELPKGCGLCQEVQGLNRGALSCLRMHIEYAKAAAAKTERKVEKRPCSCIGLTHVVAPVRVGGHHLADVYLCQMRPNGDWLKAWDRFRMIRTDSSLIPQGVHTSEDFKKLYEQLRSEKEPVDTSTIETELESLASRVSRKAIHAAASKMIGDLSCEALPCPDPMQGIEVVLRMMQRAINFDHGTIMVWNEHDHVLTPAASLYPEASDQSRVQAMDRFLAGYVYKDKSRRTIRHGTLDQMLSSLGHGCDRRQLSRIESMLKGIQSFIGTKIMVDDECFAVIVLANEMPDVYSKDDEELIELVADHVSVHLQSYRRIEALLTIAGEKKVPAIYHTMVRLIPRLVRGRGSSIFVRRSSSELDVIVTERDMADKPAYLVASTELRGLGEGSEEIHSGNAADGYQYQESEDGGEDELCYKWGEGLTGAVLRVGKPLNIPGGENARRGEVVRQYGATDQDAGWQAEWRCKYRHLYKSEQSEETDYVHRPFLAVPIISPRQTTLGVIRVGDALEGKTVFSDTDQAILTICAREIAYALEAYSMGYFFKQIYDDVDDIRYAGATKVDVNAMRESLDRMTDQKVKIVLPWQLPLTGILAGLATCFAYGFVMALRDSIRSDGYTQMAIWSGCLGASIVLLLLTLRSWHSDQKVTGRHRVSRAVTRGNRRS